jgi:hypothetical protein
MAFDAGAIEATLTLNRNPFTAGLAAARAQARNFAKEKYTATANIDVDAGKATAEVIAFRKLLNTLNDQTVKLRANTRAFGSDASSSFGRGTSHFQKLAAAVIAALPVIASGFTAAVGAVGALTSALLIAGLGAGALALVLVPAFKKIKDAVAGGQAEINKLPPGLREAGNAMKAMQGEYDKLIKSNQRIVGISLASWFNAATAGLKTLNPLINSAAQAFSTAGARAETFFKSAWWQQFVKFLSGAMLPATDMLFRSIFALIQIVGNLTRAFWDLGGSEIMGMITDGLEEFAAWTEKIGQNKTFIAFMEAAKRSLPVVGAFLGEVVEFVIKLAIALEPFGTLILTILTEILDKFNSAPLPVIQALALAIGAVWAAMALGATGPVGIAIGVLGGLAVIFTNLYKENDTLRNSLNATVEDLKAKWQPIWDTIVENFNTKILPAWNNLVAAITDRLIPALQRFGAVFMEEVWPKIQPFVNELTETFIPAVLNCLNSLVSFIAFLVDVFGPTVASEMGDAITVFQGAFDIIAGALNIFTGAFNRDWTTFHQGLQEVNRGFWTIIAGMFGTNLEGLRATVQQWDREIDQMWRDFWGSIVGFFQGFWQTIKDMWHGALAILRGDTEEGATLIGRAWGRVANFFREPINWVINTVINDGIIGAWNTVMGWIGVGGISGRVPGIPAFSDAFAAGGPVQGGVPGKDSVPILAQQGEYVLSVPAVRAMGGIGAVDAMHSAARGGAGGPTFAHGGAIPGYALGGPVMATTQVSMWSLFANQVRSLLGGLNFGHSPMGGQLGDAITRIPGALVNKVLEAAQRKLESIFQTIVTAIFGGGGGTITGGGGARAWIIAHESGGNPRAQNPTSSASGLYQMIDGTWRAYGGSTAHAKDASVAEQDAVANRYVASRYGSWENAQAFWQSHGYYDNGGWLQPGTTLATNMTGSPEAILTLPQLGALSRGRGVSREEIASIVDEIMSRLSGGGDTYNVMLPEKATVQELANSLDFKRRVVSKGRYVR